MSFGHPGLVVLQYADMFLVTLISLSHHPSQLEFDATQKVESRVSLKIFRVGGRVTNVTVFLPRTTSKSKVLLKRTQFY
jgi:hypothetical protein